MANKGTGESEPVFSSSLPLQLFLETDPSSQGPAMRLSEHSGFRPTLTSAVTTTGTVFCHLELLGSYYISQLEKDQVSPL